MRLIEVREDYSKKTEDGIIDAAKSAKAGISGNSNYTGMAGLLSALDAALGAFTLAKANALSGAHALVTIKNDKQKLLVKALRAVAVEVNRQQRGNKAALETSKLKLKSERGPVGEIGKPKKFTVKTTNVTGRVRVRIKTAKKPQIFTLEYMPSPWNDALPFKYKLSTKQHFDVNDLIPGVTYDFRGAGKGSNETLIYSDIITRVAPH